MPLDAQIGQLLQSLPPSRMHGTRSTFHTQSSDPSAAAAAAAAPDGAALLMARVWVGTCVGWQSKTLLAPPAGMVVTYSRVEKLCTDCKAAGHNHLCGKKKPNATAAAKRAAKRQRQEGARAVKQTPRGRGDRWRGRAGGGAELLGRVLMRKARWQAF